MIVFILYIYSFTMCLLFMVTKNIQSAKEGCRKLKGDRFKE